MNDIISSKAHEVFKMIGTVGFLTQTVIDRYHWQDYLQELLDADLVEESTMTTPEKQIKIWIISAPAMPASEEQV